MTRLTARSIAHSHAFSAPLTASKATIHGSLRSKRIKGTLATLSVFLLCTSMAQATPNTHTPKALASAKGAGIAITSPTNGAVVPTTFKLEFKSRRMTIMPAGIAHTESGHYHLVIDENAKVSPGTPLKHKHEIAFEKGERTTSITLTPGQHSLQLILVDHLHRPHSPALVSDKITVTVIAPLLLPQGDRKRSQK